MLRNKKRCSRKKQSSSLHEMMRSISSPGEKGVSGDEFVTSPLCMMKAFTDLHTHTVEEEGEDLVVSEETEEETTLLLQKWKNFRLKIKENSKHFSSVKSSGDTDTFYAYSLIVALRPSEVQGRASAVPTIVKQFPQEAVVPSAVPLFCYPDLDCTGGSADNQMPSENYMFVITDESGSRHYGHCRRIKRKSQSSDPTSEVICIVGPQNASKLYQEVLTEFERISEKAHQGAVTFLEELHQRPLPAPGKTLLINDKTSLEDQIRVVSLGRSEDVLRDTVDYKALFNHVSCKNFVQIFASLLLERKIIFVSSRLSSISTVIDTFTSLLYPLAWQHTLVPVLPTALLEVCCSPTPFLVGVHSSNVSALEGLDLDEVLIFDLDSNCFLRSEGDEKNILPKGLAKVLLHAALSAKNTVGKCPNEAAAELFLVFFKEAIGRYKEHLGHNKQGENEFQKEAFIKHAGSPEIREFLTWFSETQMFQIYIQEKLTGPNKTGVDLLDRRISSSIPGSEEYVKLTAGRRHTVSGATG